MTTKIQQRPSAGPVDTLAQTVDVMSLNHNHPQKPQQQIAAVSPTTATVNDAEHNKLDGLSDDDTVGVSHQSRGDVADIQEGAGDTQLPANDLDTVKFFYNLGKDYFRLCVRVPPPNIINGQTAVQTPVAGQPQRVSTLVPSKISTAWNNHQQQMMTSAPHNVVDRSQYVDHGQLRQQTAKFHDASMTTTRRTSDHALTHKDDDLLSAAEKSRQAVVKYVTSQNSEEDDDETDGEELALTSKKNGGSGTSKKEGSVSSVNSSTDVEVLSWSTVSPIHSHESQDSGWLSDVSSPTSTGSPYGSCSPSHGAGSGTDQQLSDAAEGDVEARRSIDGLGLDLQQYSATKTDTQEDKTAGITRAQNDEDGKSREKQPQLLPVRVPRYVRPVKEIPIRFRRLLEAEADRVARLCRRLQGAPIVCQVQLQQQQPQEVGRMISQDSIVLLANPEATGKATESFYGLQTAPYLANQQQQQNCVVPFACNYQPCFDASVTAQSPSGSVYHNQPYSVAQPTAPVQEFSPAAAVSTWSDVVPAAALQQPCIQPAMTADVLPPASTAVHADVIPNSFSHHSTYQLSGCSVPTFVYCPSASVDYKPADQSAYYYVDSTFRPGCDLEMNGNIPCPQQQQEPTRPTPINHAGMCFYPAAAPQSSAFSHQASSYLPPGGIVHVPVPPYCSQLLPVQ